MGAAGESQNGFHVVRDEQRFHNTRASESPSYRPSYRWSNPLPRSEFPALGVLENFQQPDEPLHVIEGVLAAEETGDFDQQSTIQRHHLAGIADQIGYIVLNVIGLADDYTVFDVPGEGAKLVKDEIGLVLLPLHGEPPGQSLLVA